MRMKTQDPGKQPVAMNAAMPIAAAKKDWMDRSGKTQVRGAPQHLHEGVRVLALHMVQGRLRQSRSHSAVKLHNLAHSDGPIGLPCSAARALG